MVRARKIAGLVLAAGLAVGGLTAGAAGAASASSSSCGGSGSVTTVNGTLADGATYRLQCPPGAWNGTLYLYSHGYVAPGSANPAEDVGDPATAAWMLGHGYALAGSSYASTGWAIAQALPDQINTLNAFGSLYGQPRTTVAWGHSLGGIITAGLLQDYPKRFDAALPMCGVLSGGVATWNTALDAEFAFQKLIDPAVQIVNITNPAANLQAAEAAGAQAQATPQGQARLALVSALGDTPGWFTPLSREPAATDYATQEANQFEWGSQVTFPFVFAFRAELEARAGGNPSWNTGVNYLTDLAKSADFKEVVALYRAAGLSLTKDLLTLNSAPRVKANPNAEAYLVKNIAFNGRISVPVLTMHTTGDGLVVPENEQAYRSAVDQAGRGQPAPPGLRAPCRALRVHPGRDGHRGPDAGEPPGHGTVARAQPGRDERPGCGIRPAAQHLLRRRRGGSDSAGLPQLLAGQVPAAVQPDPAFIPAPIPWAR